MMAMRVDDLAGGGGDTALLRNSNGGERIDVAATRTLSH